MEVQWLKQAGYKVEDGQVKHHMLSLHRYAPPELHYSIASLRGAHRAVYQGTGLGPAGSAAQFGGAPVRATPAPSRPGYDSARSTGYEAPRSMGYDTSAAPHYETSRAPSYEPPRGLSYDATRGPGYEAHNMTSGAQGAAATANPVPPYMMNQMQTPYGSAQAPAAYGGHLQATYGTPHASNRSIGGYEAPARNAATGGGGGGGTNQGHR